MDLSFKIANETCRPSKKQNNEIKYIIVLSNHPTQIIQELANTINHRLSRNSSSEKLFNEYKCYYEDALNKTGYKTQLNYKISSTSINHNNKIRKRNNTQFNPPYNQSVSTNVAQTLLKLIDKYFSRLHRLCEIFNHNTIKVRFRCTDNRTAR